MNAKKEAWGENTRATLAGILPLETPLSVSFEASSLCNLRCSYCAHGVEPRTFPQRLMDFDAYCQAVDSLKKFPQKIKNILFALNGEPTTNPQLPEMIRYLKKSGVAKNITMFTNGILLKPALGEELLDAGLTILRVSIQGVSDERYHELCGVKTDYQAIVENIAAFYTAQKERGECCHVFVKIVDQSFQSWEDEQKFYADFGDICDQISVETIVPLRIEVDYTGQETSGDKNLIGQQAEKVDVCAQPFYAMYVRSNNNVTACCITDTNHLVVGNILEQGLDAIWNSKKLREIRRQQLLKQRYQDTTCAACDYPYCGMQACDRIDAAAQSLYTKMFGEGRM